MLKPRGAERVYSQVDVRSWQEMECIIILLSDTRKHAVQAALWRRKEGLRMQRRGNFPVRVCVRE